MSRFRFSIKYLLAMVALIAGGCAALTSRSPVWAYIVCIVFGSLLVFLPVIAIYGHGSRRRFAGGFALAAWLYVLLVMWQFPAPNIPGLHSAVTGLITFIAQQTDGTLAPASSPPTLVQPPVAAATDTSSLVLDGDPRVNVPSKPKLDVPASLVTPQAEAPPDFDISDSQTIIVPPRIGFPVSDSSYPWENSPDYAIVNGTLVTDPTGYNYLLIVGHALAAIAIGFLAGFLAVVLAPAEKGAAGASVGDG